MMKEKINVMENVKFNGKRETLVFEYYCKRFYDDDVFIYTKKMSSHLHSNGIILCGATKVTFTSGKTKNIIMTDDGFHKLPPLVKRYLIFHEWGHIMNGHLDYLDKGKYLHIYWSNLKRSFGFTTTDEIVADLSAAEVFGKGNILKSLSFLIKNTNLPFLTKLELRRRARAIATSRPCE